MKFESDCDEGLIDRNIAAATWWNFLDVNGIPMILYGHNGEHLFIFPSRHVCKYPIALARATKRAYQELKGSGLKVRWPEHEPKVARWAEWLGVNHIDGQAVL